MIFKRGVAFEHFFSIEFVTHVDMTLTMSFKKNFFVYFLV